MTEGKFSEKYKFKRLLQTQPDMVHRYRQKQIAINSIPAIRDTAIYEGPISCEYILSQEIAETEQQTRINQGTADWPRRIVFPEQTRQLYEDCIPIWSVNVTVSTMVDYQTHNNVKSYQVRIKRYDAPVIATMKKNVGWRTQFNPVPPDEIRNIENNENIFFYLTDAVVAPEDQDPWDIWSAGLVPNLLAEFNACFYDKNVAQLYAESLRAEVNRIEKLHFKN